MREGKGKGGDGRGDGRGGRSGRYKERRKLGNVVRLWSFLCRYEGDDVHEGDGGHEGDE